MNNREIFAHVDHTILTPICSRAEVDAAAQDAQTYGAASLVVPPCYVSRVHAAFPQLTVTAVIGFPLGYQTSGVKVYETIEAVAQGASEIDMVINQTDVKNGDLHRVMAEIVQLREAIGQRILKVIVETCYLTQQEKIDICHVVEAGGADFIKTSTGFGLAGADINDIHLLRKHLTERVQIKASGGIRTKEQMIAFLEAGASRLGCSAGIKALFTEKQENNTSDQV